MKIYFELLFYFLLNRIVLCAFKAQSPECMEPFCFCLNQNTLHCTNFTRFDQLDFRRTNGRIFEQVEIRPLTFQIDLNEKLSFVGLRLNGRLSLSNIRSINAFYNPFRQIMYERFDLAFYTSTFKFYGGLSEIENSTLTECDIRPGSSQMLNFIFSGLRIQELILCGVYFENTMCPLLFRNSIIQTMIITDPFGAFGFRKIKQNQIAKTDVLQFLNSNIRQIEFDFNVDNADQPQWIDAENILNPDLFLYLDRINIISARRLAYIQEDTFKFLPSVKKLEIKNVRLKDLLTYNKRWLKNLNYRSRTYDMESIKLNSSNVMDVFQFIVWINDDWDFNEEKDICLFKSFAHNKLVFPFLLFSKTNLPCTCTIYWLYKYFAKYQEIYNLNQNIAPYHCFTQSNWDRCQFDALFNRNCPNSLQEQQESYTTLIPSTQYISQTSTISQTTTTTTTETTTTSSMIVYEQKENPYSMAAFYLAIVLCVLTVFIIAALIVLYCLVCADRRRKYYAAAPEPASTSTRTNSPISAKNRNVKTLSETFVNAVAPQDEYI